MVNKTWEKEEIYDLCVCCCEYCDEYFCTHHPRYNWLNPIEPLMEDRQ